MKKLNIDIELLSPVIITESKGETILIEAGDSINGTVIRGILANRFIKENNLGENAHENKTFMKLFFGNISYSSAMPLCGDKRAMVIPRSLQRGKKGTTEGNIVKDLAVNNSAVKGYKSFKGIGVLDGNIINPVDVKKEITLHMSRNNENERIAGKSINGGVFNYEAVMAGQIFRSEIFGAEDDLKLLLSGSSLKEGISFDCRIGRSHFTQYGKVKVTVGKITDTDKVNLSDSDKLILRLDTSYIPENTFTYDCRQAAEEIANSIQAVTGGNITVGEIWGSVEELDSFVNIWGMRRPRTNAVAAGTIFTLIKDNGWQDVEKDLAEIIYSGVGLRTEEGYGQLRLWNSKDLEAGKSVECTIKSSGKINNKGKVAELAKTMIHKFILGKMREYAYDDAYSISGNMSGTAHFFTRMDNILGSKESLADRVSEGEWFSKKISNEIKKTNSATTFKNYLNDIQLGSNSLMELLVDRKAVYYIDRWHNELKSNKSKIGELLKLLQSESAFSDNKISDGEFFYEYWHWLFRYARKRAADKEKG